MLQLTMASTLTVNVTSQSCTNNAPVGCQLIHTYLLLLELDAVPA